MLSFLGFLFLMSRRPPRSTRPDTLFPYTTLFRSGLGPILDQIVPFAPPARLTTLSCCRCGARSFGGSGWGKAVAMSEHSNDDGKTDTTELREEVEEELEEMTEKAAEEEAKRMAEGDGGDDPEPGGGRATGKRRGGQ